MCRNYTDDSLAEENVLQFILERVVEGRVTTKASVILQLLSWVSSSSEVKTREKKASEQEGKFLALLQHLPLGKTAADSRGSSTISSFNPLVLPGTPNLTSVAKIAQQACVVLKFEQIDFSVMQKQLKRL